MGRKKSTHKTYFIQCGKDGPIKIGRADKIFARLKALQCGSPYKLTLLGYTENDELGIRDRFDEYKIRGEWFYPVNSLLDYIQENNRWNGKNVDS